MTKAWEKRSRRLFSQDLNPAFIGEITTRVLSSRYPAYGVKGGIFDILNMTGGDMYGVTNREIFAAMDIFQDAEGIDIVPASGAAVAALMKVATASILENDATILLNITGGGEKSFKETHKTYEVEPLLISKNISEKDIGKLLCNILKKN